MSKLINPHADGSDEDLKSAFSVFTGCCSSSCRVAVQTYDRDNDGYLNPEELKAMMLKMDARQALSSVVIALLLFFDSANGALTRFAVFAVQHHRRGARGPPRAVRRPESAGRRELRIVCNDGDE